MADHNGRSVRVTAEFPLSHKFKTPKCQLYSCSNMTFLINIKIIQICLFVMREYIKIIPIYTKISAHSVNFPTKLATNRNTRTWFIFVVFSMFHRQYQSIY